MFAEDRTDERQAFQLFAYGCDLNGFECFCLFTKSNKDAVKQIGLCVCACVRRHVYICVHAPCHTCVRACVQPYLLMKLLKRCSLSNDFIADEGGMTSLPNCFDNVRNCFRVLTAILGAGGGQLSD